MSKIMEKLALYGEEKLSDLEIATLILGEAALKKPLTEAPLEENTCSVLRAMSLQELQSFPGIGKKKAALIKGCLELFKRVSREDRMYGTPVKTVGDSVRVSASYFQGAEKEKFIILALNAKHRLIRIFPISEGSLIFCPVHPREVFRPLIREGSVAAIALHNHPSSGDPEPSEEDIEITKRLVEAGKILGIPLLDHVIVGEGRAVSFSQRNPDWFK